MALMHVFVPFFTSSINSRMKAWAHLRKPKPFTAKNVDLTFVTGGGNLLIGSSIIKMLELT